MSDVYDRFVRERLAADDPNVITRNVCEAIASIATDWVLWGDGEYREDTVCSICGSDLPGVCGHQNDHEQHVIFRREYRV